MTRRRSLSNMARINLFIQRHGKCAHCETKIMPGKRWDVDHIIPIALGGSNKETNLQILCWSCHITKTAYEDIPRIAKTKRQMIAHAGAKRSRRPLPCGRDSPYKKTIDGRIVKRKLN
jgi:5-methylcytosine-specific restriction endonuclease McrA